ncbi:MAG: hypothetical protein RSE18_01820 [Acinetobacter sp.]
MNFSKFWIIPIVCTFFGCSSEQQNNEQFQKSIQEKIALNKLKNEKVIEESFSKDFKLSGDPTKSEIIASVVLLKKKNLKCQLIESLDKDQEGIIHIKCIDSDRFYRFKI